jgi:hypothetical protein
MRLPRHTGLPRPHARRARAASMSCWYRPLGNVAGIAYGECGTHRLPGRFSGLDWEESAAVSPSVCPRALSTRLWQWESSAGAGANETMAMGELRGSPCSRGARSRDVVQGNGLLQRLANSSGPRPVQSARGRSEIAAQLCVSNQPHRDRASGSFEARTHRCHRCRTAANSSRRSRASLAPPVAQPWTHSAAAECLRPSPREWPWKSRRPFLWRRRYGRRTGPSSCEPRSCAPCDCELAVPRVVS